MKLELVAELINGIIRAVEEAPLDPPEPKPVPSDKLAFNKLPPHWCHTIRSQMVNARFVQTYFDQHIDVERGMKVATLFRSRYLGLREQRLLPGDIMTGLYDAVVGVGSVTNDRIVAAGAVLAFLFDACDIFEDKPSAEAA